MAPYLQPRFLGGINQHRPAGKQGLRAWRVSRACTLCFHVPGHSAHCSDLFPDGKSNLEGLGAVFCSRGVLVVLSPPGLSTSVLSYFLAIPVVLAVLFRLHKYISFVLWLGRVFALKVPAAIQHREKAVPCVSFLFPHFLIYFFFY